MKTSFILHIDSLCILDKMNDEQAGKFLKAIYQYQKTKELPELDPLLELVITPFINQFFRDEKKYEKVVERNRENGEKGGRPAKEPKKPSGFSKTQNNPDNPSEPKKADSDNDSVSDSVNDATQLSNNKAKKKYRSNIKLTVEENSRLVDEFGVEFTEALYDYLSNYKKEKGYTSKDDNLTIRRWVVDAVTKKSGAPVVKIQPVKEVDMDEYLNRPKVKTAWD